MGKPLRKSKADIDPEELRSILDYDPETGDFRWLTTHGKVRAGDVAGTFRADGYRQININHTLYLSHRLAWLYVYDGWPPELIDHKDHDKANNKINNLRLANYSQNGANRKESATGIRKRHRRYEARIKKDGQEIYLGLFASSGEAMKAYGLAAAKYFGDFAK